MKKIFFILFSALMAVNLGFSYSYGADGDGQNAQLDDKGQVFMKRFQSCLPAKYETDEAEVLGRVRNGSCIYVYKDQKSNDRYYCALPMQVVIGYTSTMLDSIEYASNYPEIAEERTKQNNEIKKIMHDYCKKIQR